MAIDLAQQQDEFTKLWNHLVARSSNDAAFKQRLLVEPKTVLTEHGVELPPEAEVRVHEGPWATVNLTVPSSPSDELTDEELDFISGGSVITCSAVCCSSYMSACLCDTSKCIR